MTNKGRVYYTFYYNDMLLSRIDASGALTWIKKLPKRQSDPHYKRPPIASQLWVPAVYGKNPTDADED